MRRLKINSRFSLPFGVRLPIATTLSFVVGMGLGVSHGSQVAGLRFRAENAHRLPTTPTGWYLYHKSKNYQMAFGGVKEGFKMGAKVSVWTFGFFYIEDMFDRYRGTKDFINTVIASLSVAGVFSMWSMSLSHSLKGPFRFTKADHCRPISDYYSSENGEEWAGYWGSIWVGARRAGSSQGTSPGICGLHSATRTSQSRTATTDRSPMTVIRYGYCISPPPQRPVFGRLQRSSQMSGREVTQVGR